MFSRFTHLLEPPAGATQAEQLRLGLLNVVTLSIAVLAPIAAIILVLLDPDAPLAERAVTAGVGVGGAIFMALLWWLARRGYGEVAGWLVLLFLFVSTALGVVTFNGVRNSLIVGFLLVVALSSLILPEPRSTIVFVLLSLLTMAAIYGLEVAGVLVYPDDALDAADLFIPVFILVITGMLVTRSEEALRNALSRVRQSEMTLSETNEQLEALNLVLEARVAARTRALEISSDVSRRLSTILDRQELITEVVNQLQQSFNYYHVHVYLVNEAGDRLVMAGGSGEAGELMLQRGHSMDMGVGLVGRAAQSRIAVLVPDVTRESAWVANPLLPETRAEVAVPIILGDEVLGVLDVQHNIRDGLTTEDTELLTSIANQVAVGLQNARLYEGARQQAERELMLSTITQRIQDTTTVEQALQVAVRELGRALDGQATLVQLHPAGHDGNGDKS